MSYSPLITIMLKAARKAAKNLQRDFGELSNLQVSQKGPNDFVSAADLKSEKIIMEELERARPGYSFLSEEAGEINNSEEYRWIIDPLDGTINFLHAVPVFCISIALEKKISDNKTEIIAAVIEAPILGETYIAEKGYGAWIENHNNSIVGKARLRVSARRDINHALIMGGFDFTNKDDLKILNNFATNNLPVRINGSTVLSLAYIAAGKCDIYLKRFEKYWDVAAGILLIREAGGIITNIHNDDHTDSTQGIIATNNNIRKELIKFLN